MTKIFLCLFAIVTINCAFATANQWCNIQCQYHAPHVLCDNRPNSVSPRCGANAQPLTPQDKQIILDTHNSLRQKVASGQERRGNPGPQPATRNMPTLVWDDELASIAQTWANQCNYGHRCSHLGNSNSDKVGQNIAIYSHSHSAASYESLVQDWYKEVDNFNRNYVKRFPRNYSGPTIGHYTQLVWGETTRVGCGGMKYQQGGMHYTYLVCNYGPAGNRGDVAVY